LSGPTSFVAAEIHLGRGPAGIYDDWPHCNIQVACHTKRQKILFISNGSEPGLEIMKPVSLLLLEQIAQKLGDADE
jgi:hypothetical protein